MNDTMEKVNFGYSLKNIPIPKREPYMKSMIDKTHKFLKRMRWRAYFFDNPTTGNHQRENFGFTSEKSPPIVKDTLPFEADMYELIKNIQYKQHYSSNLQQKINSDIRSMRKTTTFLCQLTKQQTCTNSHPSSTTSYSMITSQQHTQNRVATKKQQLMQKRKRLQRN